MEASKQGDVTECTYSVVLFQEDSTRSHYQQLKRTRRYACLGIVDSALPVFSHRVSMRDIGILSIKESHWLVINDEWNSSWTSL